MKVKIRAIKRAWAYCDNDSNHGKTRFELIITTESSGKLNVWLCPKCIDQFGTNLREVIDKVTSQLIDEVFSDLLFDKYSKEFSHTPNVISGAPKKEK